MFGYPQGGWDKPSEMPCMLHRPVRITSHLEHVEPRQGYMGVCSCQCDKFIVWQIVNQQAPHLQCAECGAVYCLGKDCNHEHEEDRQLLQEGGG